MKNRTSATVALANANGLIPGQMDKYPETCRKGQPGRCRKCGSCKCLHSRKKSRK